MKVDSLRSQWDQKPGDKNMLVTLMQKPDKRNRALVKNLHIGFSVFQVDEGASQHRHRDPRCPDSVCFLFQTSTQVTEEVGAFSSRRYGDGSVRH